MRKEGGRRDSLWRTNNVVKYAGESVIYDVSSASNAVSALLLDNNKPKHVSTHAHAHTRTHTHTLSNYPTTMDHPIYHRTGMRVF